MLTLCKWSFKHVDAAGKRWHLRNKRWEEDLGGRLCKKAVKEVRSVLWQEAGKPVWGDHCM